MSSVEISVNYLVILLFKWEKEEETTKSHVTR